MLTFSPSSAFLYKAYTFWSRLPSPVRFCVRHVPPLVLLVSPFVCFMVFFTNTGKDEFERLLQFVLYACLTFGVFLGCVLWVLARSVALDDDATRWYAAWYDIDRRHAWLGLAHEDAQLPSDALSCEVLSSDGFLPVFEANLLARAWEKGNLVRWEAEATARKLAKALDVTCKKDVLQSKSSVSPLPRRRL